MTKVSRNKIEYISLLSVISAIAVIFLHTNGCFWNFSRERYWITANIIECTFYFAVPIFFMITGVTLLDYSDKYDTKEYFKKRIKKTLIPFLVWSFIGLFYFILKKQIAVSDLSIKYVLSSIISTKIVNVYWFFPYLFSIYLSIPLFAFINKKNKKMILSYIAIISFILNSFIPFLNNIFELNFNISAFKCVVGSEYLLYIIIGYLIHNYDLDFWKKKLIYVLGVVGLILHIFGTQYLSLEAGFIVNIYKGYTNVPCVLYSTSIFLFFKEYGYKIMKNNINIIIHFLSNYTFSMYLLHFFIIDILKSLFNINITSIIYRLFGPVIIVIICVGLTYFIRKIKYLNNILP